MIEPEMLGLSVRDQCRLLGISRSGMYYAPRGPSSEDLAVMRLLDGQYTRTQFYGVERMTAWLHRLSTGPDGEAQLRWDAEL